MERKKYVISSAQAQAAPHSKFLKGLEHYANDIGAEIIILPMIGREAKQDWNEHGLSSRFYNYNVVGGHQKLNNNLQIHQFHLRPQQVDPATGLPRFVQRGTSLIYASPKQRLKTIPHSNTKMPKMLITTGACTQPNYATGHDVSAERRRLGEIAQNDHVYGAIVAEIENGEQYHIRNIVADTQGNFVDLGTRYGGNIKRPSVLEALVLGDIHQGYTDPKTRKANYDQIQQLNPQRLILHDMFDGHSVSHWKDKRLITQQITEGADKGFLSLEQELQDNYSELMQMNQAMQGRDIYVVASNHLEFLDRYLDEGRFTKDALNAKLAFYLAHELANERNPVEAGINLMGQVPDNIHFLKRDEDLKIKGYQLGSHGDKGPGGGRGSITSRENDYGKSITGHSHSAEIQRETYVVGTSTPLTIFYNRGTPTNWTHTNALLYDNGKVQMVHTVNGRWKGKALDQVL